jgi:hypothetical protein
MAITCKNIIIIISMTHVQKISLEILKVVPRPLNAIQEQQKVQLHKII